MKTALVVATVLIGFLTISQADTGFLDRNVRIGSKTYRYQVYVPIEYNRQETWPVIVDLHGNGRQGSDGLRQTAVGLATQIRDNRSRYPMIAIFPQAQEGTRWLHGDMEELVIAELDQTMKEFRVDPARVYLMGFSMGATGAYRIAYRWPNRFAAMVAIAGHVDTTSAPYTAEDIAIDRKTNAFVAAEDPFRALSAQIGLLPVWIFHGASDESVPVEQSRQLVSALQAFGRAPSYTEYADTNHVGGAQKAYADQAMLQWLLVQQRKP